MRHRKAGKQLSRNSGHRRALLRNMVTSLIKHGEIETTDTKAKVLRPIAERIISLAKEGDLPARRRALSYLQEKDAAHRLFDELKGVVQGRAGGYISIVKKGNRKGDGAPVSIMRIIDAEKAGEKAKPKKSAAKAVDEKGKTAAGS
ncbi:MAG: 50S ribosomal protein L17 [Deltaproteobacteria bacterium CG_4_8_14_3_um_filter_51_11]|nr:50S ribosomal protein L17 [bacterium]OIP39437.1 MAG: 50S ribosomal protein L17 [Desulfobacteraceae bacterium CG2_30_51_40]PIP45318.1 MAG: 50S ribosomal protein L17 [Deltaproteobacteria bacterium CG23_combo_of_CG06-09_8_20_14_all_51_20]PIW00346.1 MAG: 50S ribosomal protein L17 [Deltaproteobacteria bacterium CG17_big_fil_post_rev_8_21_14_2_50_51_6]PIX21067.1 MAG: 50S ribosomal protein L17 [Deltaproteobacteria bacterium CG_4_8_14_3_um_filter_51_11]PIY22950.1 MAG: 50S ribosomal protein L17 [Del